MGNGSNKLVALALAIAAIVLHPASGSEACSNYSTVYAFDSGNEYYYFTTEYNNFTCDEYCCGSYCCSDCSSSVSTEFCPWAIGLIVFGIVFLLFLIIGLPIISCYCCHSNRVEVAQQSRHSAYQMQTTSVVTVAYPTTVTHPSPVADPPAKYRMNSGYPTNAAVADTAVPQPQPQPQPQPPTIDI